MQHLKKELHLLNFKGEEGSLCKQAEIVDGAIQVGIYVTIEDPIFVQADIPVPPSRQIDIAEVEEKIRQQTAATVSAYLAERNPENLIVGFEGLTHSNSFEILSD